MKKVLYISNIEVPYRVRFFNELAKHCNLTVLYERKKSSNRDEKWTGREKKQYKTEYLEGFRIKNESTFSLKILKYIFSDYDTIIIGCYNSPVQMFAVLVMKLFRIQYMLNLDGEIFIGEGLKSKLKKFFLSGAEKYLVAGEKSVDSVISATGNTQVFPYYFSSLSDDELKDNRQVSMEREDFVLVVGQYFDYKGMDVALEAAKKDSSIKYKFVGMGKRTHLFIDEQKTDEANNVEIISFLEKEELEKEYRNCSVLLLPSRQECWGLVVNEAASFGTPIVSTWGSGAAVEFLSDEYPEYLAEEDNADSLYNCIVAALNRDKKEYSEFLIEKSKMYSIEKSVEEHIKII